MPWLFRFGATGPLRHTSWSTKRGGVQRCSSCTQCADAFKRCGKTKIQMEIWHCQIAMLEAAWFNVDSTSKCLNGRFQLIWLPWWLHEWLHSRRASLFLHFLQYKRVFLKIQPTLSIQFLQDGSKFSLSLKTQPPKNSKKIWWFPGVFPS